MNRRSILGALLALPALFLPKPTEVKSKGYQYDREPNRWFPKFAEDEKSGYKTVCVSANAVVLEPGETSRVNFIVPPGWKVERLEYTLSADGNHLEFVGKIDRIQRPA